MKFIKPMSAVAGLAFLFSCGSNNTSNSADTTATANADTTSKMAQTSSTGEQDFINYAVPANTKEIIWIEAGIKDGHNKELKHDAKMMLKDHKNLDSTVSAYLNAHKSLSAPVVDTANTVNINDKKAGDWDKAWVDKMVDDHSGLLEKLQKSQSDVKDTALLAIIASTIPVVQSHLTMAKTLQSQMK
jgi:putative membrane protein